MSQPIAVPAVGQPPTPKPPLTAREKSGARIAGGVGFLLLSLGWALFGIPLALLAFGAFFALLFAGIQRAAGDDGPLGFLEGIDLGAFILPMVLVSVVGLAIMVAALFVSRGILRSRGIERAWPVTFAAAGIAIVASWVVSGLLSIPLQFTGIFAGNDMDTTAPFTLVVGGLSFLAGIASTVLIGAFAWWWMAHVLRPAVRAA